MHPDHIIQHFHQITGHAPTLLVRAPGRINLIGEHTDYNEGFVLPAAIDKAIYFAVSARTDNRLELYAHDLNDHFSADLDHIVRSGKGWPDYLLGVVDQIRLAGYTIGGFNAVFGGDIPAGSGLSSSAAVENGMGFALNELFGLGLGKINLIHISQRAENQFVGMNCGVMDMFASMMGRRHHALRLDCRSLEYEYYPFEAPDYTLLLCNSGVKHALVDSAYNTRRLEAETGVRMLRASYPAIHSLRDVTMDMLLAEKHRLPEVVFRRCKHVVEENERVERAGKALAGSDWAALGALLYQSHEGLQHEYEVSCPEMDFLVDFTRSYEAVAGARMMGGGFGGCTLNLIHRDAVADFSGKIRHAYQDAYRIDPVIHEVELTDGVGIL
jgi:galactokinase